MGLSNATMSFSRSERSLLTLLAFIQFSHIVDFMIIMPLGPQLMRIFKIDPHQFGLLVSIYTFFAGLSGFLGAMVIDRFDRKRALQVFYVGFSLGTIACALSPSYPILLTARAVTGIFGGVLSSLVLAIVGDVISFERRGAAMGVVMTAFSFASVLGVPLGLYLSNTFSWHTPFLFLGILSLAVSILVALFLPRIRGHLKENQKSAHFLEPFKRVLANRDQLLGLVLMACVIMGQFSVIPFISPSLVANAGFLESQLTYIYLVGGAVSIISGPLVGKAVDRYGAHKIFALFIILSIFPLCAITNLGKAPLAISLFIAACFFICVGGRMIPAQTLITSTAMPQERGGFMSISNAIQQTSAAIASYVGGTIVAKGPNGEFLHYHWVGYLAVVFSLLALVVSRWIRPKTVS